MHVRNIIWSVTFSLLLAFPAATTRGDDEAPASEHGIRFGEETTHFWEAGVSITATGGPCKGLFATVPVPIDWPEQSVKLDTETISENVRAMRYRTLPGNVKQMMISIPLLNAGASAQALLRFEITRRPILPPPDTSVFVVPKKVDRKVRLYLNFSPFIESRHAKIRSQAKEIVADKKLAWERVEAIYDWVRDNIKPSSGNLKGGLAALRDGNGSREDVVSLFIALCRSQKIPARTVWLADHCYAEFYLHDGEGVGHWFPCQNSGKREFGEMSDTRPILQKGDNIRVPEKKTPQRFVAEFLRGAGGGGRPTVTFTRRLIRD